MIEGPLPSPRVRARHLVSTSVLLLVLAVGAAGCGLLGTDGAYTVRAQLSRSFSLFPGSPVKVLGVDVGRISDIVVPDGAEVVEVVMRISGDVDLPAGSSATVVPASLLGERYVQLEPYTEGPRLADGAVIPADRTAVPYEFDEVLSGLEDLVGGLEPDEVSRLVTNVAETLDGQGEQLGATIDAAGEAIGVLRDNDTELIGLASRLADLNQTLSSRDRELAALLQDFDAVAASLVGDRDHIDGALGGLARVTAELDGLLEANRDQIEADVEVLTRVGRTVGRNLGNVSTAVLSSAELFRHADRIIDRERGFLPLQDQLFALGQPLTESIVFRIQGLCLQAGLPGELCGLELIEDLLGGVVCAAPIIPCRPEDDTVPLEEALLNLATGEPELGEALVDRMLEGRDDDPGGATPEPEDEREPAPDSAETTPLAPRPPADLSEEAPRGLLDGLGDLLGGGR